MVTTDQDVQLKILSDAPLNIVDLVTNIEARKLSKSGCFDRAGDLAVQALIVAVSFGCLPLLASCDDDAVIWRHH